jgi:hypothetical protein
MNQTICFGFASAAVDLDSCYFAWKYDIDSKV